MITHIGSSFGNVDGPDIIIYRPHYNAGDLMIAHIIANAGGIDSAPAGWTLLETGDQQYDYIYWKIAGSYEPSYYTWSGPEVYGDNEKLGSINTFRGVNSISPIGAKSKNHGAYNRYALQGTPITPVSPESMICIIPTLFGVPGSSSLFTNYRISNDNPTVWTRDYDAGYGYSIKSGLAYANRPENTSTGIPYVNATADGGWYNLFTIALSPPTKNLTISAGAGGTVSVPGSGTFVQARDSVVTITAVPAADYHFVAWTGGIGTVADPTNASTTITMENNYNIQATFAKDFYEEGYIGDVIDCSADVTAYTLLEWDKVIPSVNQVIYIQYRSSPDLVTWSDWKTKNTSPITSFAIPVQRYFEWRVFLTTSNITQTPRLDLLHFQIKKEGDE